MNATISGSNGLNLKKTFLSWIFVFHGQLLVVGHKPATVMTGYGFDSHSKKINISYFYSPCSNNEAKLGVEFRHSTGNVNRNRVSYYYVVRFPLPTEYSVTVKILSLYSINM